MHDQSSLFDETPQHPPIPQIVVSEKVVAPSSESAPPRKRSRTTDVRAASAASQLADLRQSLSAHIHMGTSSWSFPGWTGLVWEGEHSEAKLAKDGLAAYAAHPLLNSVSLDRAFYRPLSASQYARYAAQVPESFRFVVKAPSLVTDAQVREEGGKGFALNPAFLNPDLAIREFLEPVLEGLGQKIGALVFQISPLPYGMLHHVPEVIERIGCLLQALPAIGAQAPQGVIAVEVRDAAFLSPMHAPLLIQMIKRARATNPTTYCLGLHARMPPIDEQLPVLRALWPGPLVCRWNLHRRHGAFGYESAKQTYEPFDRLVDPDPETRTLLARVMSATAGADLPVYATINNKAEGSAPLSVVALAEAIASGSVGARPGSGRAR